MYKTCKSNILELIFILIRNILRYNEIAQINIP